MIFRAHDIPRVVWWGQPFSHFCGKGGSGADAPLRRYRNIPKVVLERPRGVFGAFSNAWYHDIRPSIMFLNIQHYIQGASKADHYISFHCVLWCPSIFHDIPIWSMSFQDRQTMISLYSIWFHSIVRHSMIFQYMRWSSHRLILHDICRNPMIF